MPRPIKAMMPPTKTPNNAKPALPEDRPAPINIAPTSVMMLAMNNPYILSMSRHCDIERGYHSFLYISFGYFLCEGHQTRGIGFFYFGMGGALNGKRIFIYGTRSIHNCA